MTTAQTTATASATPEVRADKPGFTPGPWRVSEEGNIWSDDGYRIANLTDIFVSDECEANARLIAAAPAMYAALQECITYDGATAERSHTMALKRLQAINDIARAALALAEGRAV